MQKNNWGIVKSIEQNPTQQHKLSKWEIRADRVKSIIELGISNTEIHNLDLSKPPKKFGNSSRDCLVQMLRVQNFP